MVKEFARSGIVFAPATNYAPELLVEFAQFTRRGPSTAERKDIEFGWKVAKEMGRLDVGQSICIRDRATMAVEAIEGTDLCIERAGQLCRGSSFTVIKVAKPNQDMRFDVPTIGLRTLETMASAGARCLAIESGKTILLDQQNAVRFADQHGIVIVSLTAEGALPVTTNTMESEQPDHLKRKPRRLRARQGKGRRKNGPPRILPRDSDGPTRVLSRPVSHPTIPPSYSCEHVVSGHFFSVKQKISGP